MKSKKTLIELEQEAEHRWEKEAERLIQAIAVRENVDPDELYPYLVSFHLGKWIDAKFKLPGHSPIFLSGHGHEGDNLHKQLQLTKKGLSGDYVWHAHVKPLNCSPSFMGCASLGEALLMARWSYEQDKRALWR